MLLGGLSALILLIGQLLGGAVGLVIAAVVALGLNAGSYFYSDKLAIRAMRAEEISPNQAPRLHAIVADLTTKQGMPMPRLYISPTSTPNAFATGRNPTHAAVCVTRGILDLLDERELRGVLGHEISHVRNRDILTSPLAAGLIQAAISRSREHAADTSGADVTGDPRALADALGKIDRAAHAQPLPASSETGPVSSLMIANPFSGHALMRLFSTHPQTEDRVARLHKMADTQNR